MSVMSLLAAIAAAAAAVAAAAACCLSLWLLFLPQAFADLPLCIVVDCSTYHPRQLVLVLQQRQGTER